MSLLQRLFPNRASQDAMLKFEQDLSDAMRRVNANSPKVNEPDRWSDRLVPQVFAAKILGTSGTANWGTNLGWLYTWEEVERTSTTFPFWATVSSGRNSTRNGTALNAWEGSIGNTGGNQLPIGTTITRLPIPAGLVVDMVIDFRGRAWFSEQNPVQTACDDTQGLLSGGDGCDGTTVDGGYAFTDISGGSATSTDFYDMDGTHAFCNAGES